MYQDRREGRKYHCLNPFAVSSGVEYHVVIVFVGLYQFRQSNGKGD
jgi:hypothetical protein